MGLDAVRPPLPPLLSSLLYHTDGMYRDGGRVLGTPFLRWRVRSWSRQDWTSYSHLRIILQLLSTTYVSPLVLDSHQLIKHSSKVAKRKKRKLKSQPTTSHNSRQFSLPTQHIQRNEIIRRSSPIIFRSFLPCLPFLVVRVVDFHTGGTKGESIGSREC